MKNTDLQALMKAVEQLIQRNTDLHLSNTALREEHAQLLETHDLAQEKIEAMISRLKALECKS